MNIVFIRPNFLDIKEYSVNTVAEAISKLQEFCDSKSFLHLFGDYLVYERTGVKLEYLGMINQLLL